MLAFRPSANPRTARWAARAPVRLVGLILVLTLTACDDGADVAPLRVGVLVWPPYELAFLARDLGYFDSGNLELVDYESPAVAQRAYREGAIDVVAMTSHYLLDLGQTSDRHRVPLVIDASHGGDVLIARPEIQTLADLRGRRIAVESGSLGAYMLLRALDHAGLGLDDVERVSADIPEQEMTFLAGEVDAVITYEPVRTRLIARGGRVLFDSSDIPDEVIDVLIVRDDTVRERARDLGILINGWLRALEFYERDPRSAAERMAPREQLTPDELIASLKLVRLPDRARNIELLDGPRAALRTSLERQRDTMLRAGQISNLVAIEQIPEPRFLRANGG